MEQLNFILFDVFHDIFQKASKYLKFFTLMKNSFDRVLKRANLLSMNCFNLLTFVFLRLTTDFSMYYMLPL